MPEASREIREYQWLYSLPVDEREKSKGGEEENACVVGERNRRGEK